MGLIKVTCTLDNTAMTREPDGIFAVFKYGKKQLAQGHIRTDIPAFLSAVASVNGNVKNALRIAYIVRVYLK